MYVVIGEHKRAVHKTEVFACVIIGHVKYEDGNVLQVPNFLGAIPNDQILEARVYHLETGIIAIVKDLKESRIRSDRTQEKEIHNSHTHNSLA